MSQQIAALTAAIVSTVALLLVAASERSRPPLRLREYAVTLAAYAAALVLMIAYWHLTIAGVNVFGLPWTAYIFLWFFGAIGIGAYMGCDVVHAVFAAVAGAAGAASATATLVTDGEGNRVAWIVAAVVFVSISRGLLFAYRQPWTTGNQKLPPVELAWAYQTVAWLLVVTVVLPLLPHTTTAQTSWALAIIDILVTVPLLFVDRLTAPPMR